MTDQRLRDLERDAARGDLHAQARLLLERVRVGDLAEDQLLLAAYLGDAPAQAALASATTSTLPDDIDTWARSLKPFGQETSVRAALGVAGEFMTAWRMRRPSDDRPVRAIQAAVAWLHCPCPEHVLAAATAASSSGRAADEVDGRWTGGEDEDDEGHWVQGDAEAVTAARFAAAAAWCAANPDYELLSVAARSWPDQDVPRIRKAMVSSLVRWALTPRGSST